LLCSLCVQARITAARAKLPLAAAAAEGEGLSPRGRPGSPRAAQATALAAAASTSDTDAAAFGGGSAGTTAAGALVGIEERVLSTNGLLEAFGNARTVRNDNSSRFGKYMAIQFDNTGRIVGASIANYLLEKTRIVRQADGERNFHVFYQVMAAASAESWADLDLTGPEAYAYTNQSGCVAIEGRSDLAGWQETKRCLDKIGVSPARRHELCRLLAAVLRLGNLDLAACQVAAKAQPSPQAKAAAAPGQTRAQGGGSSADAGGEDGGYAVTGAVACVAELLRVEPPSLLRALTVRFIHVPGQDVPIPKRSSLAAATDLRDTLAKAIYSNLFLFLVHTLNDTIKAQEAEWGTIGVLDIYGFEKFDVGLRAAPCFQLEMPTPPPPTPDS
jgi:myosin-5